MASGNATYTRNHCEPSKIDLTTGGTTYASVIQVPNDVCVDSTHGRLFVVNKGSSLISEYATDTLADVRDIAWTGTDWGPTQTQFKIYCTPPPPT